ncbi:hypothetical protein CRG98_042040 [Punica granatum]|uniref:Uncharacterized protein n=1 Tax=Punica granatum TaxID=22663 RepID=A0A2I0I0R3_PUNGR|nr:hypothetical protein CRG98_042040 [Punica granatum]
MNSGGDRSCLAKHVSFAAHHNQKKIKCSLPTLYKTHRASSLSSPSFLPSPLSLSASSPRLFRLSFSFSLPSLRFLGFGASFFSIADPPQPPIPPSFNPTEVAFRYLLPARPRSASISGVVVPSGSPRSSSQETDA